MQITNEKTANVTLTVTLGQEQYKRMVAYGYAADTPVEILARDIIIKYLQFRHEIDENNKLR